jgi:hypothetical protein
MTTHMTTKYGIIDEDALWLRHPRVVDEEFETLAEAFAGAAQLLVYGSERVSVVTAKMDRDGVWVEVASLAVLEAHDALYAHTDADAD